MIVGVEGLWILRRGYETPELLEAWDYVSIDENSEGYQEACEKALAAVGGDVEAVRYVTFEVDLTGVFDAPKVKAEVTDYRVEVAGRDDV